MALAPGTGESGDALDFVEVVFFTPGWQLVTREYRCDWPEGWTLWSTPDEVGWPFELTRSEGQAA